ncbi:MAG: MFS transporter [Haloarculaceae archaeon]
MTDRDRVLLAGVVFAVLFAQVLLYPGIPALVHALGGTPAAWGGDAGAILNAGKWFLTAEFLGFVLFAGVWGALSDSIGRRTPLIAVGAVAGAASYLLLVVVARSIGMPYSGVLLVRFLGGAATIGAFSLAITTLMDLDGGNGRNMGAAGIAIGLGTALGAPIGGQLYAIGPLVPLTGAALLMGVAGGLALTVADRVPDRNRRGPVAALGRLRSQPILGLPYALGFIDRLTAGFFALVGTVYFQTELGLDAAGTGVMLGLFFVPFALLQYPFGRLSDRIGRVGPVAVGSLVYGVAVIAVFYAPTVEITGATMVAVGILGALMAPATMALVSDIARHDERGVAMGGFNVFGSLGFLTGIVAGATIAATYGFGAAFVTVGLAEVGIALLALPFLVRLDIDPTERDRQSTRA